MKKKKLLGEEEVKDEFVNLCLCTPMFSTCFLAYIWILLRTGSFTKYKSWQFNNEFNYFLTKFTEVITKIQRQGVTMVFTRQFSTWRLAFSADARLDREEMSHFVAGSPSSEQLPVTRKQLPWCPDSPTMPFRWKPREGTFLSYFKNGNIL